MSYHENEAGPLLIDAWIEDTDDKGQYPEQKATLGITKKVFSKQALDPVFRDPYRFKNTWSRISRTHDRSA